MKRFDLAVSGREDTGKGPNRRLRVAGRIPAVLYGTGSEAEKVSLDYREFDRLIRLQGAAKGLFNLGGDLAKGGESVAVIREIQRDPVTRRFLHVDLYKIRMDQENDFEVAVQGTGVPAGVREGGILETHLRSVTVRCLPAKLPSSIAVDLLPLRVNQSLHVRDLTLPDGVTLVTDGDEVLYTVLALRVEKVAVAEVDPTAPAATPEVIGKKKPEEVAADAKGKAPAGKAPAAGKK